MRRSFFDLNKGTATSEVYHMLLASWHYRRAGGPHIQLHSCLRLCGLSCERERERFLKSLLLFRRRRRGRRRTRGGPLWIGRHEPSPCKEGVSSQTYGTCLGGRLRESHTSTGCPICSCILGWIDFDLGVPPSCLAAQPIHSNSHQRRQNRSESGTLKVQDNPSQAHEQIGHPVQFFWGRREEVRKWRRGARATSINNCNFVRQHPFRTCPSLM